MKSIRSALILVLTALIWGIAFVAQTTGGEAIGPYSFNCIRSFMGAIVLIPVIKFMDYKGLSGKKKDDLENKKTLIIGGICCGICLGSASLFQQVGLFLGVPAGKAGFLTTCYIVMVPILGLFLHKKCGWNIWLAVAITLLGLYLLCMNGSIKIQKEDALILVCSVLFSMQILCIDHFAPLVDPVRLSQLQFLVAAIISLIPTVFVDIPRYGFYGWGNAFLSWEAWIPLLYAGIMSSGVAYTLQIVGQIGLNPTIASIIMSLESVFSVLAGWALLGQHLSRRELLGCLLIFVAVILAQVPTDNLLKKNKN